MLTLTEWFHLSRMFILIATTLALLMSTLSGQLACLYAMDYSKPLYH